MLRILRSPAGSILLLLPSGSGSSITLWLRAAIGPDVRQVRLEGPVGSPSRGRAPKRVEGEIRAAHSLRSARPETHIALGALISSFDKIEVATDDLQWRPHINLRGLESLPVRVA